MEVSFERKLGIDTRGRIVTENKISLYRDESNYSAAPYIVTRKVLLNLSPSKDDVLMDYGCGKGRIVCFAAAQTSVNRVVGVELYKHLYDAALANINNLNNKKAEIDVFHADAVNFTAIDNVTIFIIFNPFREKTLEKVLKNIESSLKINPRTIHIAYCPTPNLARLFEDTGWLTLKKIVKIKWRSNTFIFCNK